MHIKTQETKSILLQQSILIIYDPLPSFVPYYLSSDGDEKQIKSVGSLILPKKRVQ